MWRFTARRTTMVGWFPEQEKVSYMKEPQTLKGTMEACRAACRPEPRCLSPA